MSQENLNEKTDSLYPDSRRIGLLGIQPGYVRTKTRKASYLRQGRNKESAHHRERFGRRNHGYGRCMDFGTPRFQRRKHGKRRPAKEFRRPLFRHGKSAPGLSFQGIIGSKGGQKTVCFFQRYSGHDEKSDCCHRRPSFL